MLVWPVVFDTLAQLLSQELCKQTNATLKFCSLVKLEHSQSSISETWWIMGNYVFTQCNLYYIYSKCLSKVVQKRNVAVIEVVSVEP
jgi:hypothetical protein